MAAKKKTVTPEEIIQAFKVHKEDMIIIDWANLTQDRDGRVKYYINIIKLADGTLADLILKYTAITIIGCKDPDTRKSGNKPIPATFGFYNDTLSGDGKNSPVGEAVYLIHKSWLKQVGDKTNEVYKGIVSGRPNITPFVQEFRYNNTGTFEAMSKPICRIKYRCSKRESLQLRNPVRYVVDAKKKLLSDTINGMPIDLSNIHLIATSGSIASGAINFGNTILSTAGYANSAENESQIIAPSKGKRISDDELYGDDLLSGLTNVSINDDPVEEDADEQVNNLLHLANSSNPKFIN